MRGALTAILLGLAAVSATFAPATASAETSDSDLAVGTRLTATTEVKLHQAIIARGSKVSVFGVSRRRGHVASVDVQLADGHVVPRVDIATIRTSFRVSAE